jgi:methionine-gamma-lyase
MTLAQNLHCCTRSEDWATLSTCRDGTLFSCRGITVKDHRPPHRETEAIHATGSCPPSQPVKPSLCRTSSFVFSSAEEGAAFFMSHATRPENAPSYGYARTQCPTVEMCEARIVAVEPGATHAILFPSGMNAISTTILAFASSGDTVVTSRPLYGGTYAFLHRAGQLQFGIRPKHIPFDSYDDACTVLDTHRVPLILIETPANPTLHMTSLANAIRSARRHRHRNTLVAVDNTFLGPVHQHPLDLGADIVIYSATKFIGGHSDCIAGVVLTRSENFAKIIRRLRDALGACPSPDTAWLLSRSLETLFVRVERASRTACHIARVLNEHPRVASVAHPSLLRQEDGAQYDTYRAQCTGPGAVLSFTLRDDSRPAAFRFLNALHLFTLAVSIGGTESLAQHPRSMTHACLTAAELDHTGISEGLIRLSIGLEHVDDLIHDLIHALDAA